MNENPSGEGLPAAYDPAPDGARLHASSDVARERTESCHTQWGAQALINHLCSKKDGSISLSGAPETSIGPGPIISLTTLQGYAGLRLICGPFPRGMGAGNPDTLNIPADHKPCPKGLKLAPRRGQTIRGERAPLYPNLTIDLHVRTAASLHQGFPWLHPIQA